MAALLTSVRDDKDKTAVYLGECRSMGIEVTVPDVNTSFADFTPHLDPNRPPGIVFGLAAVRNVGESLVERIVAEREAGGAFSDFYDFCRRVDSVVLNRRTIESLIKAGAFDSLGHPRQGLTLVADEIIERTLERRKEHEMGIATLFAAVAEDAGDAQARWEGTMVPIPEREFDKAMRLAFEKEMLGLYISDHPLMGLERALARHTDTTVSELKELAELPGGPDANFRSVGGVITDLRTNYTKAGQLMARFMLEDLQSAMEVFVFPKTMAEVGSLLENDAIVVIRGKVDTRDDTPKITAMGVTRPSLVQRRNAELRVQLPLAALTDATVAELKAVLQEHPGESPVLLHVGEKVIKLPEEYNVDTDRVVGELRRLLGPDALLASAA